MPPSHPHKGKERQGVDPFKPHPRPTNRGQTPAFAPPTPHNPTPRGEGVAPGAGSWNPSGSTPLHFFCNRPHKAC